MTEPDTTESNRFDNRRPLGSWEREREREQQHYDSRRDRKDHQGSMIKRFKNVNFLRD